MSWRKAFRSAGRPPGCQSDVPAARGATRKHRSRRHRSGASRQIRRYEDTAGRQQAELERVTAQARRMGCDSSGFFQLFNGQSAQCGPVTHQIQRMRTNLQQITTNLERLRAGNGAAAPTATISATPYCWRWRRTIAARNMRQPRGTGFLLRQPVRQPLRQSDDPAAGRFGRAIRNL